MEMLKSVTRNLLMQEQIVVTVERARAVRPIIQMLIDNARKNDKNGLAECRQWIDKVDTATGKRSTKASVTEKLYGELAERYKNVDSTKVGYTRSYTLLHRKSKHIPMAVVELIDGPHDTLKALEREMPRLQKGAAERSDLFSTAEPKVQGIETPYKHLHPGRLRVVQK